MNIIILAALIMIIFMLYIKDKKVEKIEEKINEKNNDTKMMTQEALTNIKNINDSYYAILQMMQGMNENSASSNQVISDIHSRISSINDVIVNKKSRGNWGEYQLNTLLSVYAGESKEIFEPQYALKNGYIGDVALHLPGNDRVLMIDSKFPLENYQNLNDDISEVEKSKYVSLFKSNIKKHIKDISKKYISSETVDTAVMFVPSEAIYFYICSEHSDLIDFAHRSHVLITSPTTLLGVVFTLVNSTKEFNRAKNMKKIEKEIIAMSDDSRRLVERIEKTASYFEQMGKSLKDTKISAEKISDRVLRISNGYVEEKENETN